MVIVDLTVKLGWSRNYSSKYFCNDTIISYHNKTMGELNLNVSSGILVNPFKGVYCTDYSVIENWSYGQVSLPVIYQMPYMEKFYNITYFGSQWIPLLNNGTTWNLITNVYFTINSRTNKLNRSPISSMSPLIFIPIGCPRIISILATDPDGDIIKCRWSEGIECGDSCIIAAGVTLDEIKCILHINLSQPEGYYAIKLHIEDFQDENSLVPMSSIPLEFLLQSYEVSSCLGDNPVFLNPTPDDNTCIPILLNQPFKSMIVVNSSRINNSVIEIDTVSPPGLIKSQLLPYFNDALVSYVNLTWTPTMQGFKVMCFIGLTQQHFSTDQRCITLAVGYEPPSPLNATAYPINIVTSNQTQWFIAADQNLTTPLINSSIRFYDNVTNLLVYTVNAANETEVINNELYFNTNKFLQNGKSYYITFDSGVFRGVLGCNLQSQKISDPKFWQIKVQDFTCEYCSTHGTCVGANQCSCEPGWTSTDCSVQIQSCNDCYNFNCLAIILTVIIGVLLIIILALLYQICIRSQL